MVRWLLLAGILSLSSFAVAASEIDLNVNNEAVRVTAAVELRNELLIDGSYFYHDDRGDVFGAGFHVTGPFTAGVNALRAGLGVRLLRVDSDVAGRDSGTVLPIGGFVNYRFPGYDRFSVGGSVYYSPDVLSFGDTRRYSEYNAWAAYSVVRRGQVYLGVRSIKTDFERSPEVTFDTGMHVGLRLQF
ncbi:MAG: YfaZ family outer membrane protein [Gammaproteobacteria bacterium]|jgi:hypothetical protein